MLKVSTVEDGVIRSREDVEHADAGQGGDQVVAE